MAPAWLLGHLLTLTLLLFGEFFAHSEGSFWCFNDPYCDSWCYNDPKCGPNTWLQKESCDGNEQSPIDINPDKATHNPEFGSISLTAVQECKQWALQNTGTSVLVELRCQLQLRGPGLPATYTSKAILFHWGNGNSRPGSEHYINGSQYAMELQIYLTNVDISVDDVLSNQNGFAALGFFVQGDKNSKGKTADAWTAFTRDLPKISTKGQLTLVDGAFSVLDMLATTNFSRYYRYFGSFTTPKCNKVVTWTIFPDPILVPLEVVEAFPKLYSTNSSSGPHLERNFRPLQIVGNRKVETSVTRKIVLHSAASLDSQPARFLLLVFIAILMSFLPYKG